MQCAVSDQEKSAQRGTGVQLSSFGNMRTAELSATYREISKQLRERASKEKSTVIRRDLEAQAEHFLLLAETFEATKKN
jgi:hypothetical protein